MRKFLNKNSKLLVGVLVFVIVLLCGIVIYANFFNNKTPKNEPKEEEKQKEDSKEPAVVPLCYEPNNKNVSDDNYYSDVDGNRTNNSAKIKESHKVKDADIMIEDVIIYSDGKEPERGQVKFNLRNNTSEERSYYPLRFKFYSQSGELLSNYIILVDYKIGSQQFLTIDDPTCNRVIDAYDFTVELDNDFNSGSGG